MDEIVDNVMKHIFEFTKFKSKKQRDGVFAVLKGDHDVYINLPPSSGKSLCYELPAIISQKKSTIVFVRNNNIAQEHINFFIGKNVSVCHIDSSLRPNKKIEKIEKLKSETSTVSLIYIPVSLCNKSWIKDLIMTLGNRDAILNFVVDEAVYISQNSVSFNKLFLNIAPLRNMFPSIPLIALSAIGTKQIKHDVFETFGMKNPTEIIDDFWILPNIYLQIKMKDIISNPYQDLIETINNFKETVQGKFCGIVYCRTKTETFCIAQELSRQRISTVPYHASMTILDRKKNKSMWKVGKAAMIAVTQGSGIGLEKSNISCIIHWHVPSSIGEYYQQISKAGRNGVKALCCMYFSLYDWMSIKKSTMGISFDVYDDSEKMIQFCLSDECRHVTYSRYFESITANCKNFCDCCVDKGNVQKSLEEFNDFQIQHRLLPTDRQQKTLHDLNVGVYVINDTKNYLEHLKPCVRLHWYRKLAKVLIENYNTANSQDKKIMTMKNLCRLARNLEYLHLVTSYTKGKYIFAISSMINAINKQTIIKNLSYYISNYNCVRSEHTDNSNDQNIKDLLILPIKKSK